MVSRFFGCGFVPQTTNFGISHMLGHGKLGSFLVPEPVIPMISSTAIGNEGRKHLVCTVARWVVSPFAASERSVKKRFGLTGRLIKQLLLARYIQPGAALIGLRFSLHKPHKHTTTT